MFAKPAPGFEKIYCKELSALILANFGKPYYPEHKVKEILAYCLKFYTRQFKKIIKENRTSTFYHWVFLLNEEAGAFRLAPDKETKFDETITREYFAMYRRLLKMILEEACSFELAGEVASPDEFRQVFDDTLGRLLFLGEKIYDCAASHAEHSLIEDPNDISFDENGLYVISRRHHYEHGFQEIINMRSWGDNNSVIDPTAETDFDDILQEIFGFTYTAFHQLLIELHVHHNWKPGHVAKFKKEVFTDLCEKYFNVAKDKVTNFIEGFILSKACKLPVHRLATHPHSYDRLLHRPILQCRINGEDFLLLGYYTLFEAVSSMQFNAIPWGKGPTEWCVIPAFEKYMNQKKEQHDQWLDDEVEKKISPTGCIYERTVKRFYQRPGFYLNIENESCGEIDFLVINKTTKTLFILECKHLIARSDMPNWKQDFSYFTGGTTRYNKKLQKKINWISNNLTVVQNHFRYKENDAALSLTGYKVTGVFVINTPSFYMYNSDLRIYLFHDIDKVITGEYKDKVFSLLTVGEDRDEHLWIKYPYFRKKHMMFYDDPDWDLPCDKYGYPIRPSKT